MHRMVRRAATVPRVLALATHVVGRLPQNRLLWSYTIRGRDGSAYITRSFSPRVLGWRGILHQIHRPDVDPHPHNHPWRRARFVVVSGGYLEERVENGAVVQRWLLPGDENRLNADVYHRILDILPDTWTVGLVGARTKHGWGFLVDGTHVTDEEYFARQGHRSEGLGL